MRISFKYRNNYIYKLNFTSFISFLNSIKTNGLNIPFLTKKAKWKCVVYIEKRRFIGPLCSCWVGLYFVHTDVEFLLAVRRLDTYYFKLRQLQALVHANWRRLVPLEHQFRSCFRERSDFHWADLIVEREFV